ncbi:MAG: SRPBCC family protein [candidate division Zixibacteria bacterium]|nr:SRPBCC family protein [candidate division Zixibacteria bacterium]
MPEASLELCFNLPVNIVWKFVSDFKNIGSCLRFVGGIEKSGESYVWKVKPPMSITTRTSVLKPEFLDRVGNKSLSWIAKGEYIQWGGRFDLENLEKKKTKAKIELEVSGLGPMSVIIDSTAALQIKNQLKYFAEQIKKKLEGESITVEGSGLPFCDEEEKK